MRILGEKISDVDVCAKLLRSVSGQFESITTSIEKFQDLNVISLDVVIETLKLYEHKFKERLVKRDEKALLAIVYRKSKNQDLECSRGRERGSGKWPVKQDVEETKYNFVRNKSSKVLQLSRYGLFC